MFTLKKTITNSISGSLACAMILGTSILPSLALNKDELLDGVEYQLVSQEYALNDLETIYGSNEMGIFFTSFSPRAEILVDGETETFSLTIYVANDEDTGYSVLSSTDKYPGPTDRHLTNGLWTDAYLKYEGIKYYADTVPGLYNPDAPEVTFTKSTADAEWGIGFRLGVKINAGQSYTCDVMTFDNLPVSALDGSLLEGTWGCNGKYQNTSTLTGGYEYYNFSMAIDLEYEEIPSDEAPSDKVEYDVEETHTMEFGVKVLNINEPTYTVTIPESFDLTVSDEGGVDQNYTVAFVMDGYASVTISAESDGTLKADGTEDTLAYTNTFTEQKHTGESGSQMGNIFIDADDMKAVESGHYTGTVDFHFGFSTGI